jgi:hypothetical protein
MSARKAAPAVEIQRLLNRRTGFLLHLSEEEKALMRLAAGEKPLAAWIREVALEAASK